MAAQSDVLLKAPTSRCCLQRLKSAVAIILREVICVRSLPRCSWPRRSRCCWTCQRRAGCAGFPVRGCLDQAEPIRPGADGHRHATGRRARGDKRHAEVPHSVRLRRGGRADRRRAWAASEGYDVRAVAGENTAPSGVRERVHALLEERFVRRTHRERRDLPVYALTPARRPYEFGPNVRNANSSCSATEPAATRPRAAH